ncbi:hypothetical protein RJ639_007272 [Escallonia herrerae]|uniref:Non-haem dioxygenase N-terminal domain-containing protein n=1 Tax=Escallonia herrerae TaxID=1293975 RepID=A0AA89ASM4_9ASTE|nr:hypothetical protein RJ639_007272 [Escallonia herrerae]
MAITSTQTRSRSSARAEPPSPIPTGKGYRSAANSIFSNYVDGSKRIPELTLPGYGHRSVLPDIDYKSLVSGDPDYVDLLLRSVLQFGAFRISGHGISGEELRLEAESLLGASSENRLRYGDHKELLLCSLDNEMAASVKDTIGAENYRSLSLKIENVAKNLEEIAEELAQVISSNTRKKCKIQPTESALSLYRCNHATLLDQHMHWCDKLRNESRKYALSLHLSVGQGDFVLRSEKRHMSFNKSTDAVIVTIGEKLEEWSLGEFKSFSGKLNLEQDPKGVHTAFLVELKCSPSKLNLGVDGCNCKTMSIADQILVVVILAIVYTIFELIFL